MTRWSLTTPYPNWTVAYWTDGHPPKPLLEQLATIPGVTYGITDPVAGRGTLRVPHNAWVTEPVRLWAEMVGPTAEPPVLSHGDYGSREFWEEKGVLRSYQLDAVEFLVNARGGLLCDSPGLGKTAAAIVAAYELTPPNRPILIVGPSYTRAVWQRELRRVGVLKSDDDWCALEGLAADEDPYGRFWFCHYDILEAWRARLLVPSKGSRASPYTVIADELHNAMNPRSKRTKALLAIAAARPVRIGLTGTPLANRPRELWPLLTFIDGPKSWGTHLDFRIRHCSAYQGDFGWLDGAAPSHIAELKSRMAARYIRRTKSDVALDLPPMRRQGVTIESDADALSDEERKTILQVLLRRSGHEETLRLIGTLRKQSSRAKKAATIELAERLLADNAPGVVIFCHERAMVDSIAKKLGGLALHGGQPLAAREEAVRQYQSGATSPVLVATFGALREGVTLTRASNLILHDLDWVPSTLLQTEARVHRLGAKEPVTIYWMILRRSVDDLFLSALATKGQQIEETVAISDGADAVEDLSSSGVAVEVADQFKDDVETMLRW